MQAIQRGRTDLIVRYEYVTVFFFFFQAEDGIRDLTVTGVQTCALPIWLILQCAGTADVVDGVNFARSNGLEVAVRGGGHSVAGLSSSNGGMLIDLRSEERRVGEEGRTRGAPDHLKKKKKE